jgi:hypothetical protein
MTQAVTLASIANSGYARNRIINGNMVIDQRNNGAAVTSTADGYCLDRWAIGYNAPIAAFTAQRSTTAPAGFSNSLLITTGTGAAPSTTGYAYIRQGIEGLNISDLNWGTANAQPITISFWVRSSITGTFGFVVRNGASDRSYGATYTISSANTFEYKTVTIPGDTTGTWLTTNGIGIMLLFDLGVGSTYSLSAGSWQTPVNVFGVTGTTKLAANTGATFYITGVQLEVGTQATPYEFRQYGDQLLLCQRYYEIGTQPMLYIAFGATGIGAAYGEARYAVTKRAAATVTGSGWQYYAGGTGVAFTPATVSVTDRFYWANAGFTNWNGWVGIGTWAANAEL